MKNRTVFLNAPLISLAYQPAPTAGYLKSPAPSPTLTLQRTSAQSISPRPCSIEAWTGSSGRKTFLWSFLVGGKKRRDLNYRTTDSAFTPASRMMISTRLFCCLPASLSLPAFTGAFTAHLHCISSSRIPDIAQYRLESICCDTALTYKRMIQDINQI